MIWVIQEGRNEGTLRTLGISGITALRQSGVRLTGRTWSSESKGKTSRRWDSGDQIWDVHLGNNTVDRL